MTFDEWIREERKVKKYISRQSVWEAALRHGGAQPLQTTNNARAVIAGCSGCECESLGLMERCIRCIRSGTTKDYYKPATTPVA